MIIVETILWVLGLTTLVLPFVWPAMFSLILNISDLIKKIRGKSIDENTWLDEFNEKLDDFNQKIAVFLVPMWPYFTFPVLTCLSIYKVCTETVITNKVVFFLLGMFFLCIKVYLIRGDIQFKKIDK